MPLALALAGRPAALMLRKADLSPKNAKQK
jgi:hypothetical protein